MTIIFICALGISMLGMGTILALKQHELSTGTVFFSAVRPRAGYFFNHLNRWLTEHLPVVAQRAFHAGVAHTQALMHRSIAKGVIATEFVLERALSTVKEKTTAGRIPGEASAFLREVADHKKKLLHRSRARRAAPVRAIVEE